MPVTFLDYPPMDERSVSILLCLVLGGVSATLVLVALYFDRRRGHRIAKWRAIGLTPQTGTWDALLLRDNLAGEYRGRSFTVSSMSDESYENPRLFTRVQVGVRFPSESRLTITPKWPSMGLDTWLDRIVAPQTSRIEDAFSIQSDPLDLAEQSLALPRIREILLSYPKPAIELKGNQLRFERPGYFPDPQDAVALYNALCDLAEFIEQGSNSPGAGI